MLTRSFTAMDRPRLLSLGIAAFARAAARHPAGRESTGEASPTVLLEQLDDALLAAMKAGGSTSFDARYRGRAIINAGVPPINNPTNKEPARFRGRA
jgi:hypothetical protein